MQRIEVEGVTIRLDWGYDNRFVSLTDIAQRSSETESYILIRSWLKNQRTLLYLNAWEKLHNDNYDSERMFRFMQYAAGNRNVINAKKYIEETDAIGVISKVGRGGGTYAHPDIALNFCNWLDPEFEVYVNKEFQRLKEEEFQLRDLKFHLSKITDHIDEVRNWLDTIPHQDQNRNRLKAAIDGKKSKNKGK